MVVEAAREEVAGIEEATGNDAGWAVVEMDCKSITGAYWADHYEVLSGATESAKSSLERIQWRR